MIAPLLLPVLIAAIYWLFMSPHSQMFGKFPYRAPNKSKVIALTFDDGPNEPYTSQILDYLNSKHIKATFFQVGACVERFPELTRRIEKDGHLIGNHSFSHQFSKYFSEPGFGQEIARSQAIFQRTLGKVPVCFRPPWLMHHPLLLKSLRKHGLIPISGDFCHPKEFLQPPAAKIARSAVAKAKPGAIIIFHDGFDAKGGNRSQTVEAVRLVVEGLSKQGYKFVRVDKLLGIKKAYR